MLRCGLIMSFSNDLGSFEYQSAIIRANSHMACCAMQQRIVFLILALVVAVFVFSFDRWGQRPFVSFVLSAVAPSGSREQLNYSNESIYKFPNKFIFGTSSSAYQIEGAWDEDGKSASIWDDFVHFHHQAVDDNATGDVSVDSYHHIQEDVKALKLVGVISSGNLSMCRL